MSVHVKAKVPGGSRVAAWLFNSLQLSFDRNVTSFAVHTLDRSMVYQPVYGKATGSSYVAPPPEFFWTPVPCWPTWGPWPTWNPWPTCQPTRNPWPTFCPPTDQPTRVPWPTVPRHTEAPQPTPWGPAETRVPWPWQ